MNHIEKTAIEYTEFKYGKKPEYPEAAGIWDDCKADYKAGYQQAVNDIIGCHNAAIARLEDLGPKSNDEAKKIAFAAATDALMVSNDEIIRRFL